MLVQRCTHSPTHLLSYSPNSMPATIRVESGISAGTSFWIERPVLRIGSDPQCEICVPTAELPPHALTLEFRDGNYRVYNRGSAPISIGASIVQPGTSWNWPPGQTVHLPGDLRLVLQADGDPRPAPRPDSFRDDGNLVDPQAETPSVRTAGSAGDAAGTKSSKKTLIQLAIIGICALAAAAMLLMDRDGTTSATAERPSFESIVETTLAQNQGTSARVLLPRLQYAQAALVRGNNQFARERFLKLRDQLVQQKVSHSEPVAADLARMLRYVEFQLGQLQ
jgi:hypothetical protein